MLVYFVRHGQSELNATHQLQFPDTPLSSFGQQQATAVAERFRHLPVEVVLASPMQRAHQTAAAIAKVVEQPIQLVPELAEIKRPTALLGKSAEDPEVKVYRQAIHENTADDWRYSDDESFADISKRGLQFLSHLQQRPEEQVVVVTHGIMMVHILALMMFGSRLTKEIFQHIIMFTHMSNTGITICKWDGKNWQLQILNDAAHLG